MNRFHPKKLLHNKWTATSPKNKEKHFVVTEMKLDEDGNVVKCVIEAVMSKREQEMNWQNLKDPELWRQGWK
ncbi:TPA: TIGR02450 family Trp-rich protein [Vibrio parahaemolyticus]|uniref:TIGR02450 family Trp-rich protein n=1 Tax=Vibrio parahaemolyticus TaxID=670 RepID=UPI00235DD970|nr:TIGR02450 family Trp-rich protein [Vibrio parahaemolyticus]EJG1802542.1 TIGR02450 family Trp-rich protein [Vibrio parahaemolyticus]MDG2994257.1 TIGR02450 family Trp-rich protein [Vibrio parahaemolyticus]HCE2911083.1 TIGR02450 family Trp-rich protein [Vibrio parahaemolyticus]